MWRLGLLVCLVGLTGCATIIHGTTQDVGMTSTPTGAALTVDQVPAGTTPAIVPLARNATHTVRMDLSGYQPFEATLVRGPSGWVFGNLVFGGLLGLGVDALSGGLYTLSPEQITAVLTKETEQGRVADVARLPAVPTAASAPVVETPAMLPPPHALAPPRLATVPGDVVQLQPRYDTVRGPGPRRPRRIVEGTTNLVQYSYVIHHREAMLTDGPTLAPLSPLKRGGSRADLLGEPHA